MTKNFVGDAKKEFQESHKDYDPENASPFALVRVELDNSCDNCEEEAVVRVSDTWFCRQHAKEVVDQIDALLKE